MATYTCKYTDTEYKFCLLFLAGHEFVEECSWLAADKEVEQYIYIALNITMNRELKKKLCTC